MIEWLERLNGPDGRRCFIPWVTQKAGPEAGPDDPRSAAPGTGGAGEGGRPEASARVGGLGGGGCGRGGEGCYLAGLIREAGGKGVTVRRGVATPFSGIGVAKKGRI